MRYLIEPVAGSDRALVFGAVWASAIGVNPAKQARQQARKARAQFYTRGRARSTVVGMLTLEKGVEGKQRVLYSAAAAFARAYDRGAVAVCLPIKEGCIWVSAAIDGTVQIGTDVIHATVQDAQTHLTQLRQQHPNLQVLNDAAGDNALQDGVFLDNLTDQVAFQRTTLRLPDLPFALWGGLLATGLWLLWQYGHSVYEAQQPSLDAVQRSVEPVDAVAAWDAALRHWAQGQTMQAMPAIAAMMASIAQMPLTPGRWELTEIDCRPTQCHVWYGRTRLADNPSLQAALPPHWAIQWLSMDSAKVAVPVPWHPQLRGNIAAMPSEDIWQMQGLTHWQRLRPAMQDIQISAKARVSVVPPQGQDADGNPVAVPFPADAGLHYPSWREVTIQAPLRTIPALQWPEQSQIRQLQVRRTDATDVNLTRSLFHATLKGVIYVQ